MERTMVSYWPILKKAMGRKGIKMDIHNAAIPTLPGWTATDIWRVLGGHAAAPRVESNDCEGPSCVTSATSSYLHQLQELLTFAMIVPVDPN